MTFQPITGPTIACKVPVSIDTGHGPYGWLTPAIAAIALHDETFAARVLYLTRGELHFIALVIALMGDKARDADHLGSFARNYGVLARKTLLISFADTTVDTGLIKLSPRFAGAPWRPATYRRLRVLFNEPNARKALQHSPRISRRHVLTLSRLPAAFRTTGVLKMIKRPRDLGEVIFAIELVRRIRTDLTDRQIIASLEKAKSSYIRSWVMKHYEAVPFPPAPTGPLMRQGVEALRPLTSYDDVARSAREFENCIRTYLWPVLKGDAYFYRYAPEAGGKGIAIVELRRAPVIGWVVHEALGPNNDPIKGTDRAAIMAAFREVGIAAAPQAVNPNGPWFNLED